ncbi:hypothetical protein AB1Y20_015972 [Prymnesium parvum]|uniref:RNA helicase n=1 Tax=Prymnesium parvum TaxID=97485 RepID=A0AB34K014_PRYPA
MAEHAVACAAGVAPPAAGVPTPSGPPAREYPFPLDEFQRIATACVDRRASVLVCAHTSAGKTLVAEHAVAAALRDGGRVVYTSPIKALSNQKYNELKAAFGDVGLLTGDTSLGEESSCLVMTTEVLRVMLYQGSVAMREVQWVVFDEAHMLGSERGWVIEECLILLPHSVRFVLLSATLPNAMEVAEWISSLHAQPVHVVRTPSRPTPLLHYACPAGGAGLFLVQDGEGRFLEAAWQSAVASLKMRRPPAEKGGREADAGAEADPRDQSAALRGRAEEVMRVVRACAREELLPAIVFCFSRTFCEVVARAIAEGAAAAAEPLQLLAADEAERVQLVFDALVETLSEEDAKLPQVRAMLPLLLCGVGIHHSGVLPVLRELVELLFADGALRVLIATETVAMGLNLPARTVIFSSTMKYDGEALRGMRPTEYTQMAGRAGRRGMDARGHSIVLLSHWMSAEEARTMLSSRYEPLHSQFHVKYSSLLKLCRAEGTSAAMLLTRSLAAWQEGRRRAAAEERRRQLTSDLAEAGAHMNALARALPQGTPLVALAEQYLAARLLLDRLGRAFHERVRRGARPWLHPGRVLCLGDGAGTTRYCVLLSHRTDFVDPPAGEAAGPEPSEGVLLHVLLRGAAPAEGRDAAAPADADGAPAAAGEPVVASVPLRAVSHLTAVRLWVPRQLDGADGRASVALSLDAALQLFEGTLPPLDPLEHMEMHDAVSSATLAPLPRVHPSIPSFSSQQLELAIGRIDEEEAHLASLHAQLDATGKFAELYAGAIRRRKLRNELRQLNPARSAAGASTSKASSTLQSERQERMHQLLARLGYMSEGRVLLVKGHAACCIDAANELLAVEVLMRGILNGLGIPEMAALLSVVLSEHRGGAQHAALDATGTRSPP